MDISEKELVQFSRLALSGKSDDVALFVRRLAKKIRSTAPETAESLLSLAKDYRNGGIARGSTLANLPVDLESRLELAKIERQVPIAAEPIWTAAVEDAFEQIVVERMSEEALAHANLHPARSLLFVGPPGVGKTLSGRWLARKLNMPFHHLYRHLGVKLGTSFKGRHCTLLLLLARWSKHVPLPDGDADSCLDRLLPSRDGLSRCLAAA